MFSLVTNFSGVELSRADAAECESDHRYPCELCRIAIRPGLLLNAEGAKKRIDHSGRAGCLQFAYQALS